MLVGGPRPDAGQEEVIALWEDLLRRSREGAWGKEGGASNFERLLDVVGPFWASGKPLVATSGFPFEILAQAHPWINPGVGF